MQKISNVETLRPSKAVYGSDLMVEVLRGSVQARSKRDQGRSRAKLIASSICRILSAVRKVSLRGQA